MPYDPAGNYTLPPVYLAKAGQTIQTQQHNAPLEDIQQALSNVPLRDGRAAMTAPLKMGGNSINDVQNGTEATDAATVGQVPAVAAAGAAVATEKATPVDADALPLSDSEASNALKKLTWANVKATLKSYFDEIYGSLDLVAEKVAKAGDTMTGLLKLSGDPTDPLHAAPKQYVDAHPGMATAWAVWDGGNPATIGKSFGLSSIVYVSSVTTDINFSSARADTNYCVVATGGRTGGIAIITLQGTSKTTAGFRLAHQDQATNAVTLAPGNVAVYG